MSEWISVDDRLPPISFVDVDGAEYVLVFREGRGIEMEYFERDYGGEHVWSMDCVLTGVPVTHWQPLPEPPK